MLPYYEIIQIWNQHWETYQKILRLLAQREGSEEPRWCAWHNNIATCCICNHSFLSQNDLIVHGYFHLKQTKLLPFI